MATVNFSTNLALALPTTGDLSGTWGTETNSSITNMLDEALGYQAFTATGGSDTLTIPNGTTGVARSIYIQLNGTGGGTVNVPATKTKMYFVFNNTASAITFKVTGQTGVSIPASAKISLVSNGTDVIAAVNYYVGGANLGSIIPFYFANQAAFPSASTYHGAIAHSHADGAMYFAHSGNWVRMLDNGGPLGTPSSGTATNLTGLPLTTGVTGTLPIANGGTGTTSTTFANLTTNVTGLLPVANGGTATATPSLVQGSNITITGTWPNQTIAAAAPGTGTVTSVSGTGTVNGISLSGTVTSSGSLTLGGALSGVNLSTQVTGTLPIANGGTGTTSTTFANLTTNVTGTLPVANGGTSLATLTANNVIIGNGASAPLFVAPSTSGNVLTSDGSTWASTPPAGIPVGGELMWPINTVPTGFLQENGASLSRTGTYAALFAVIGTVYGAADASSFNLPDSRGRFVRVWANGSSVDPDRASRTAVATTGATMSAGDNVGTLQAEGLKSHSHDIPQSNGTSAGNESARGTNNVNLGTTNAFGGNETRPVNMYRMMIIKF